MKIFHIKFHVSALLVHDTTFQTFTTMMLVLRTLQNSKRRWWVWVGWGDTGQNILNIIMNVVRSRVLNSEIDIEFVLKLQYNRD